MMDVGTSPSKTRVHLAPSLKLSIPITQEGTAAAFDYSLREHEIKAKKLREHEHACSEILPYLFVSGISVASNESVLESRGIDRVVNCVSFLFPRQFPNIEYCPLDMLDSKDEDISWFLHRVIKFIEESRLLQRKVLVHCEKGVSRSVALVMGYIMWYQHWSFNQTFEFVKSRRGIAQPNVAFIVQLQEWERLLTRDIEYPIWYSLEPHIQTDAQTDNTLVTKLARSSYDRHLLSMFEESDFPSFQPPGIIRIPKNGSSTSSSTLSTPMNGLAKEAVIQPAASTEADLTKEISSYGHSTSCLSYFIPNLPCFNDENEDTLNRLREGFELGDLILVGSAKDMQQLSHLARMIQEIEGLGRIVEIELTSLPEADNFSESDIMVDIVDSTDAPDTSPVTAIPDEEDHKLLIQLLPPFEEETIIGSWTIDSVFDLDDACLCGDAAFLFRSHSGQYCIWLGQQIYERICSEAGADMNLQQVLTDIVNLSIPSLSLRLEDSILVLEGLEDQAFWQIFEEFL